MATASPDSVAGSGSRSSSLDSFGQMTDEREFNRPASMIPDSQAPLSFLQAHPLSKKFSVAREEVSETTLSEGFRWLAPPPPRPGQFSQRHPHLPSPFIDPSCKITRPSNVSRDVPSSPQTQSIVPPAHRPSVPPPPLDLPELGLLGSHISRSPPSEHPTHPDCTNKSTSTLQDESCEIALLQQFPKPSSLYPVSTQGKSGSQDETTPLQALPGPIQSQPSFTKDPTELKVSALGCARKAVELAKNAPQQSQPDIELPGTTLPPLSHNISVQSPDKFKLPISRGIHHNALHQAGPPSSVCGDLEYPAPRTPRSSHRANGQAQHRMPSRPVTSPHRSEKRDHRRDRSQSRASNISRKRSSIRKRRTQPYPERKEEINEAIFNVAQSWNKWIDISNDEKTQAKLEIAQLQNEVALWKEELTKTKTVMEEKDSQISNVQIRCSELEDQNRHVATENQHLNDEIIALKTQLGESDKHISSLKEKCSTCQSKLNEIIAEQQDLYIHSRQTHEESKQELQNERDRRIAESKAVEGAIEASGKKHEELKSCLQKFREEADQESRRRDEIISELNAKLKQTESELSQERKAAAELLLRTDEQAKAEGKIERVESQIQSLIDIMSKRPAEDEDQKESANHFSSQLGYIIEYLATINVPASADITNLAETLEQKIVSRILPVVTSGQTQVEETLMTCKEILHGKLEQAQYELIQQTQRQHQNKEYDEASHSKLLDLLSRLDAQSIHIGKTHEQTMQRVFNWTQKQDSRLKDMENTLRSEIVQQLKGRESISPLEETLKSLAEDYTDRVELMKNLILQSDEEAKKHLQDTIEAIQNTLSDGFNETRHGSEQARSASKTIHASLETYFRELKEKLKEDSQNNLECEELRQALGKEKSKILDLQHQLARLEHEAKPPNELHEKRQTMVKSVNVLKAQLKEMSGRLPQLEAIEASFREMLQVNQMLNSTTAYLVSESAWVNQRLKDKPKLPVEDANVEKPEVSQHVTVVKEESTSDIQLSSTDRWSRSVNSYDQTASIMSQEEAVRRKVVVYSPRSDIASPSPPPSIGQEQRQRREAVAPRSIMRLPGPSSQDSTQETQHSRITPNHSQYNRPVTSKGSLVVGNAKQVMIDQIRSSLVQPKAAERSWGLPTVADFERQANPDRYQTEIVKERATLTEENEGPNAKRVRTDDGSFQAVSELKN